MLTGNSDTKIHVSISKPLIYKVRDTLGKIKLAIPANDFGKPG